MSSRMKGLFREKKKLGVSKPKSSIVKPKSSTLKPTHSADVAQPPALIIDSKAKLGEYDEKEEVLRQFDLNMAYGPCLGMRRLDRWNRAKAWGLNPPKEVENLLRPGVANSECLWDGRV
ncbi:hypothetical protein CASFOL_026319 [Castilleja foliolosa]|uniref:DNA polymerase delta subunit 4 n=1 Tax=Castilleja foliolosa TaxID=1961234 RepID=A0ABD3CHQ0_9LAMI